MVHHAHAAAIGLKPSSFMPIGGYLHVGTALRVDWIEPFQGYCVVLIYVGFDQPSLLSAKIMPRVCVIGN